MRMTFRGLWLGLLLAGALAVQAAPAANKAATGTDGVKTTSKDRIMNNVKDFGAKGDGVTKDTAAIQAAIDAGGMVWFPAGTYVSGTLYLKSHGGLHLEPGAVLKASPDHEDYNAADFCPQNWASKNEIAMGGHLITAVGQTDVTLTGGGTIHGNSQAFLNEMDERGLWYKRIWRPSQMLYFCESTNIRIDNLNLCHSPYWHCFLHGCEFVTISNLNIQGETAVPNGDGIDIDCCRFVTVTNCVIASADDSLTVRCDAARLLKPKPAENIVFSNCTLRSGYANAIRIGVGSGVVRNVSFNNIVIDQTRTAVNVISKYGDTPAAGGTLSDVTFHGLQIDCERLCNVKLDNSDRFANPSKSTVQNIHFADIFGTVRRTAYVTGNGKGVLKNVDFTNVRLRMEGCGPHPDRNAQGWWGRSSTHAAYELKDVSGVVFDNCSLEFNGNPGWKLSVEGIRAQDVDIHGNCRLPLPVKLDSGK